MSLRALPSGTRRARRRHYDAARRRQTLRRRVGGSCCRWQPTDVDANFPFVLIVIAPLPGRADPHTLLPVSVWRYRNACSR
jgi:hypothetical protein